MHKFTSDEAAYSICAALLTLAPCHEGETPLKNGYRGAVNHFLWKVVIYINHPENGTAMHSVLEVNVQNVAIQLLVVLTGRREPKTSAWKGNSL